VRGMMLQQATAALPYSIYIFFKTDLI